MVGTVGVLNVGAGDTKLVFDPGNPQEMIRAARIVKDMLRRGYALLVDSGQVDASGRPVYVRAKDFDESKCEYVIADLDPDAAVESKDGNDAEQAAQPENQPPGKKRGRKTKRVPADQAVVVAVARSAGG